MAEAFFVWLGSNRARKQGVGEKGVLLDRAARARLPVPSGGILLSAFYEGVVADGLLEADDGRVICPDPELLHEALYQVARFPKLEEPVIVRPLFVVEEGRFSPQHYVNFADPSELAYSLCEIYAAAYSESERWDVVVMEMVEVVVRGTAVTRAATTTDNITYNEQSITLPHLGIFQAARDGIPPFAQRLQKLLRGVRRTFGKGEWIVDWADDGQVCWVLGLDKSKQENGR